jgi:glycosyltransferase involved in cell wall biosynthesis
VASSENSSLKEIVNNKNAFIFDLESDKSIVEKISECLKDEKIKKQKIDQALKDAKKFSWEKFTEQTLKELKGLKK